jgi:tripartite-type tricarboxylate transporter receptor subunit TctC
LDEILKAPDVREKLQTLGTQPAGGTPEDLRQFQSDEIQKWIKVARIAKVSL